MIQNISRTYKAKLQRICLVLFPEYKKVIVYRNGSIKLLKRSILSGKKSVKYDYKTLMEYILPFKLTIFKYNNIQFISEVYKACTSQQLAGKNLIDFYLDEVLSLKLSNEIKEVVISTFNATFEEGEEQEKMMYYLLNGKTYNIRDLLHNINRRLFNTERPVYYEVVGFSLVVLIVGFLWMSL